MDAEPPHVGNIKEPRAGAGGFMFGQDALGVGNRHVPTVEIHQLGAVFLVPLEAKSVAHETPGK